MTGNPPQSLDQSTSTSKEDSMPESPILGPSEMKDTQVKPSSRKRTRANVMKSGWKRMMDIMTGSMGEWLELTKEVNNNISIDDMDHHGERGKPGDDQDLEGGHPN